MRAAPCAPAAMRDAGCGAAAPPLPARRGAGAAPAPPGPPRRGRAVMSARTGRRRRRDGWGGGGGGGADLTARPPEAIGGGGEGARGLAVLNNGRAVARGGARSGADTPGRPAGKSGVARRRPGRGGSACARRGGSSSAGAVGARLSALRPGQPGTRPAAAADRGTLRPPGAERPGPLRGGDGGVGSPRRWRLFSFSPFSLLFSSSFSSPFIFAFFYFRFSVLSLLFRLSFRCPCLSACRRQVPADGRGGTVPCAARRRIPAADGKGAPRRDADSRLRARGAIACGKAGGVRGRAAPTDTNGTAGVVGAAVPGSSRLMS